MIKIGFLPNGLTTGDFLAWPEDTKFVSNLSFHSFVVHCIVCIVQSARTQNTKQLMSFVFSSGPRSLSLDIFDKKKDAQFVSVVFCSFVLPTNQTWI